MKMVAYDHKRMEPPAKPLRRFEQTGLKRLRRTLARKQVAPVVPAINHMITGPPHSILTLPAMTCISAGDYAGQSKVNP
jgi:hypothetical protein